MCATVCPTQAIFYGTYEEWLAAGRAKQGAKPVNVYGNPSEWTILECAKAVLQVTESKSKIAFHDLPVDDPVQRKPDISKARSLLGWEPKVQLEEGLKRSLEYFRKAVGI